MRSRRARRKEIGAGMRGLTEWTGFAVSSRSGLKDTNGTNYHEWGEQSETGLKGIPEFQLKIKSQV